MRKLYWIGITIVIAIISYLAILFLSKIYEGYADSTTVWAKDSNVWANDEKYQKKIAEILSGSKGESIAYGINSVNSSDIKYDFNNYGTQYHETPEQLALNDKNYAIDASGNLYGQSGTDPQESTLYYEPGSYLFGASTYVPSYQDSIYLSTLTGESSVKPIANPAKIESGFCKQYKSSPIKLEEACQATDKNACSSTSCCVLLGGSKCVSGNAKGPFQKNNYGDITIQNPEYYYFQGTCYGNCSGSTLTYASLGPSETNDIYNDVNSKILDSDAKISTITVGNKKKKYIAAEDSDNVQSSSIGTGSYSYIPSSATQYKDTTTTITIPDSPAANSYIDLGLFFPPITGQGNVDSCQPYSLVYYIGNYYNAVSKLNLLITNITYASVYVDVSSTLQAYYNVSGNIINPLYTFNELNKSCSTLRNPGWDISEVFKSAQQGCKTAATYQLPYNNPSVNTTTNTLANCPPTVNISQYTYPFNYMNMTILFDRSNAGLNVGTSPYAATFNITTMKYYLNMGIPIWWGIKINKSFEVQFLSGASNSLTFPQVSDNAIWYNHNLATDTQPPTTNNGITSHTMVIVGYADNIDTAKKADKSTCIFKFVNQWSRNFGDNGFGYITSNYLLAINNDSTNTRFTNGDGPTNSLRVFK
jgi:hypothetical protein